MTPSLKKSAAVPTTTHERTPADAFKGKEPMADGPLSAGPKSCTILVADDDRDAHAGPITGDWERPQSALTTRKVLPSRTVAVIASSELRLNLSFGADLCGGVAGPALFPVVARTGAPPQTTSPGSLGVCEELTTHRQEDVSASVSPINRSPAVSTTYFKGLERAPLT